MIYMGNGINSRQQTKFLLLSGQTCQNFLTVFLTNMVYSFDETYKAKETKVGYTFGELLDIIF